MRNRSMLLLRQQQLLLLALLLLVCLPSSRAVLPTAQVDLYHGNTAGKSVHTLLASHAWFGPRAGMKSTPQEMPPTKVRLVDSLLCDLPEDDWSRSIVVVPRGNCTYEKKVWVAQQGGAVGVVIYNTLASRYTLNQTETIWPLPKYDYECSNGQAWIPSNELSFVPPPYNAKHNDPLLSGGTDENLCRKYSPNFDKTCASRRCFLTGNTTLRKNQQSHHQACCAWDLHLYLYTDTDMNTTIQIPSVFLTMQQGQELLDALAKDPSLQATIASRWRFPYMANLSSIVIWMLGVAVATMAAYLSASNYHNGIAKWKRRIQEREQRSGQPRQQQRREEQRPLAQRSALQEETLELEPIHAVGFVVMASSSLFILFYFKIYNIVKVFYAFGCSNAVIQVLLLPLIERLFVRMNKPKQWIYKATGEDSCVPSISNIDASAMIVGYTWGMAWLYMAWTMPHQASQYTFFWMTQDIMGACMCTLFLTLIQLNTIQVASLLLMVAFFYDIFFVFVTPYFFKESIMITVATSGGPPKADELHCEKYPSDKDCQGGDPLPMLLTIPRLWDYEGGSSLLGLGDIVLPGLLLSFAARLDAAKTLVAIVSGNRGESPTTSGSSNGNNNSSNSAWGRSSYFGPLVVAYAIGLGMANVAVYVMSMGQPALLYLVPCCLGTMTVLGYKRQELRQLWEGPKVLDTAEEIVFGPSSTGGGGAQQQQQQQGGGDDDGTTIVELQSNRGNSNHSAVDNEEYPLGDDSEAGGDIMPLLAKNKQDESMSEERQS